MVFITRAVGPLFALSLVADILVGAPGSDPAAQNEKSTPASARSDDKHSAALTPHRGTEPPGRRRIIAGGTNPELIIREALTATAQAREIIAGNLANANTPGYKRQIVSFATVFEESSPSAKSVAPEAAQHLRVMMAPPHTDMRPGKIHQTGRPFDVAIDGEGFFAVWPADAPQPPKEAYCTRCGRFALDGDGHLVLHGLKRDWIFLPIVTVPPEASKIEIGHDGLVWVTDSQQPADPKSGDTRTMVGTLNLASFPSDCTFTPCGDGVFLARWNNKRCGNGAGNPGIPGYGQLRQGFVEESNVDPQQELEDLQKLQQHADILEHAASLLRSAKGPL